MKHLTVLLCFTYVGFFDIPSIPLKTDVIYGCAPCDKYHSTKISHFHLDSFVPLFVGIYAFISGENLRFYPSVALSLHTDPNRKYFDTLFLHFIVWNNHYFLPGLCWAASHDNVMFSLMSSLPSTMVATTKNVCWVSVRSHRSFCIFKNLNHILNKLKLYLLT